MNLHIVPDSGIVDAFYENLREAGVLHNNKFVLATGVNAPRYSKKDFPFAPLYSSRFADIAGDTRQYDKVFIHQFSPLMYRWVATHSFKELNWMVWGADLYNLPFIDFESYEPLTRKLFGGRARSLKHYLYLLKVLVMNWPYRHRAYARVSNILTWMKSEFDFARKNIPSLRASHQFFFYENQNPYHQLDRLAATPPNAKPIMVVGNSGFATNNHMDTIALLTERKIHADLVIPVSYGDPAYIRFLKKNLTTYEYGRLDFMERYLGFEEYLAMLASSDALIMNTIRPQGYGNILLMLYMNKPVFLNDKNISLPDLERENISFKSLQEIDNNWRSEPLVNNREAVANLFSHDRLIRIYEELF